MRKGVTAATATMVWALGMYFAVGTYGFSDDHFGRITPARQIARDGELPFRDFFDPGYFLTEMASAAMQRVFGDNLLGEILLTSTFVAFGAVIIWWLVRRATGSLWLGVVAAGFAVLAFRRPYEYDKFLFYPLGLLACWRYADTRRIRDLILVAIVAVLAGMFRYDNGVFIVLGALAALMAVHTGEWLQFVRRVGVFAGACLVLAGPYIVFLQLNGGVAEAVDQMVTYAQREGTRTDIGMLPRGALSELRVMTLPPPPPDRVQVRWATGDQDRAAVEARFTLHDGVVRGDLQERTWLYEIRDTTSANLRALANDVRVEDTHLIDRTKWSLEPKEGRSRRLWRHVPLVGRYTIAWSSSGAAAVVYYVFVWVALGAAWVALRSRVIDRAERAGVLSAVVITLLAVLLVLRSPVVARIGGVVGAPAVLSAWLWHRCAAHRLLRLAVALPVVVTLAIAVEWRDSIEQLQANFGHIGPPLRESTVTPSPPTMLPKPRLTGLVNYLRRCTEPGDRIFAAWFAPELYYFSGRAFAGGMVVTFGGHWSEPDHQRRIIAKMQRESVPILLLRSGDESFWRDYPILAEYLRAQYRMAGSSNFDSEDDEHYTVFSRTDRQVTGIDPRTTMPCFTRAG